MARWTDIATWRGNGENQGPGGMVEHRGLVLHIAVGWYEGTISWQRNPDSDVSSHFVVGKEQGELAQMVDTAVRAWTQGDGNGRWLSSENEGFLANDGRNPGGWEKLSAWQVEANAQLLAKAHLVYGVPLAVADHPDEKGLGHHSMDREWLDEQWGHDECPGAAIVAQKPAIVARAKEIVGGDDVSFSEKIAVPGWFEEHFPGNFTEGEASAGLLVAAGYGYGRLGWRQARANTDLLTALAAKVGGEDIDAALARHRDALRQDRAAAFAELGEALAGTLPDRIAERLTEVPAEQVRAVLREELSNALGQLRLVTETA